jgi:DNA-binding transcriptional LysR family regulator
MDVASLRWFQQVADGVTVTEVADIERVSQSGVSRALARLDDEIGTPLLRRSGRTLRLTRAGATFKRHVDNALHDLDDGFAALSELSAPDTGTVGIAFAPSLGSWLVPDLVASFRADQPNIRFELLQMSDDSSFAAVESGGADLYITTTPPPDDALRWRPLLAESLQLAVPPGHVLGERDSVGLAEVADEPFVVLRPAFALRRTGDELCRRAGFAPRIAFEGDDLSTVLGFVAAGLGIAVVPTPRPGRGRSSAGVRHLDLLDAGATREIGIAWPAERRLLPAAENFRTHVVDQLSRHRRHGG